MPNCFQLFRKGSTEPAKLSTVDEEICQLLGIAVHTTLYCEGWFDYIGFAYACGKDNSYLRADLQEHYEPESEWFPNMLRIVDYLEANYTSDCWVEIGRNR